MRRLSSVPVGRSARLGAAAAIWTCLLSFPAPAQSEAQKPAAEAISTTPAPVVVWNRTIVTMRAVRGHLSPAERAEGAAARVADIPAGEAEYRVEAKDATLGEYVGAWILVNDRTLFALLREDTDVEAGQTFEDLKQKTVAHIRTWLAARAEQQRLPRLLRGIALSAGATAAA
ncbi:MAG TPA: hypothetical protein VKF62_02590, partial [Planctomycetota bacterium]|nr:hypothetical protein [Planctomycetota bacterium]